MLLASEDIKQKQNERTNDKTQHANFGVNPLFQAPKQHLNNS